MGPEHLVSFDMIVKLILSICGGISVIAAAIGYVYKGIKKVKEPTDLQNKRIADCEERLDKMDKRFDEINEYLVKDRKDIKEINEGNKIVQKSLLAIMEQLLTDGADKKPLEDAKKELQEYLIDR